MPNPISPFFSDSMYFHARYNQIRRKHSSVHANTTIPNDVTKFIQYRNSTLTSHSTHHYIQTRRKQGYLIIENFTFRSLISKYKMAPGSRKSTRAKDQWRSRSAVERKCAIQKFLRCAAAIVQRISQKRLETTAGCELIEEPISQNFSQNKLHLWSFLHIVQIMDLKVLKLFSFSLNRYITILIS